MRPYNFVESSKRRFRHLQTVHIRNIDVVELLDTRISFHVPKPQENSESKSEKKEEFEFDETSIFESNVCESSINPSFEIEWHDPKNEIFRKCDFQDFSLQLFRVQDDFLKEIFRLSMNMSDLRFFSESMNSISFPLPLNTIVFEFVDGCFLPKEFIAENKIPCKDSTKIRCSGNVNDSRFDSKSITVTLVGGALPSPLPHQKQKESFPPTNSSTPNANIVPSSPVSAGNLEHDEVLEVPVSVVNVSELEKNIQEILELRANLSNLDHKISLVRSKIQTKLKDSRTRKKEALTKEIIERQSEEDGEEEEEEEESMMKETAKTKAKEVFGDLLEKKPEDLAPTELQLRTTDRLRSLIKQKEENVDTLKREIDSHKQRLFRLEEIFLLSQQYLLLHTKKMKEKKRILVPEYEKSLSLLEKKLRQRRGELINEIREKIYVVKVVEKPRDKVYKYTINGLGIYRYERGKPGASGIQAQGRLEVGLTDETAAALGYISHCVVMVSKILEIPLIYRLIPKSSRSLIVDSNDPSHVLLPLYPTKSKSERHQFFKAVKYLNENIVGLMEKLKSGRVFEMKKSERRKALFEEFKREERVMRTKKIDFDRIENNVIKNLNNLLQTCKEVLK